MKTIKIYETVQYCLDNITLSYLDYIPEDWYNSNTNAEELELMFIVVATLYCNEFANSFEERKYSDITPKSVGDYFLDNYAN